LDDEKTVAFQKALDAFDDAKFNFNNGRYHVSINRSYYAVFYASKALLLKKGFKPKTHKGTIHKFSLEYIVNDNFDKK
jgi:uncharacterized protein (UPF0332 family)